MDWPRKQFFRDRERLTTSHVDCDGFVTKLLIRPLISATCIFAL